MQMVENKGSNTTIFCVRRKYHLLWLPVRGVIRRPAHPVRYEKAIEECATVLTNDKLIQCLFIVSEHSTITSVVCSPFAFGDPKKTVAITAEVALARTDLAGENGKDHRKRN